MQNLIDRETRKVGKGGTENGPAILPIANSFGYPFYRITMELVMLDNVWTSNETISLFTDSASYLTCSIYKAPTKCSTRGNNLACKI
jgi:hypothetical protein